MAVTDADQHLLDAAVLREPLDVLAAARLTTSSSRSSERWSPKKTVTISGKRMSSWPGSWTIQAAKAARPAAVRVKGRRSRGPDAAPASIRPPVWSEPNSR